MPGIFGLITRMPPPQAEAQLRQMQAVLLHEPFYRTGLWCDEQLGVYLGWTSRGDSFTESMPLRSADGNLVLAFSGEEYSESQERSGNGHPSCGYLLRIAEKNPEFPASLNGSFQGLLVDRARGTVLLFNDRYGSHRIYYHEAKDGLYFAAEAKALLAARPELKRPDPRGLGEFVACGCVLENRTIFQNVHVLPPASAWRIHGTSVEKKAYFQPQEWEQQEALDADSYYEQLRDVLAQKIGLYFHGPEPIAMSLTGGLDTRVIMAWHKAPAGSLPCFTFGSTYRDCQDVRIARVVASACGQPHHVITPAKDFLSEFPRHAERTVYLTDGCTSVSHSPDLYVNQLARQIAPVRMTGNYGDEVLRRIRVFRPLNPPAGLFAPDFLAQVESAKQTYAGMVQVHPLSFGVFRQAPWHHHGLRALEQTQLCTRTPFLDNDVVRTVFRGPESVFANNDFRLRLIGDGNASLRQIRTDLGFGGGGGKIADLRRRWLHFLTKTEYAYDYGMPQWMAGIDRWIAPFHPERLFLGRHKFYHFRVWYRDSLSKYVQEILLDPRTFARPYLQPRTVEAMVTGHVRGSANHTLEIHKLLTLELTHRLFLDA